MSSGASNASWTWPPDNALNFTKTDFRCRAGSQWFGAAVKVIKDDQIDSDVSMTLVYNYLTALLPDNYLGNVTPPIAQVVDWYYTDLSDDLSERMGDFPPEECGQMVCEYLDWKGDPDISGVGMMISYYVAAVFATIFFAVLATAELRAMWKRRKNGTQEMNKLLDGFTESVNTFLDAALVFALSMLLAAMIRYIEQLRIDDRSQDSRSEPYSVYGLMGSVYMSTFAIFPALMLQSVGSDLRRHWLRLFLWLGIIALVVVLEVLYRKAYKDKGWGGDNAEISNLSMISEVIWLDYCDSKSLRKLLERAVTAGHAVLAVNFVWWLYYLVSSLVPDHWKSQAVKSSRVARGWRSAYPFLRLFNGLVALALMWLFLGLFTHYRSSIAQKPGNGYEDSTWTFGQTLALATWAPVVVDLTTVYLFGAEAGLSSKLSKRYRVITVPSDEQHPREKTLVAHQAYSPVPAAQDGDRRRDRDAEA